MENNNPTKTLDNAPATVEQAQSPADSVDLSEAKSDTIDPSVDSATLRRLVAEAENRGYIRGRNENIESWLDASDPFVPSHGSDKASTTPDDDDSCPEFLAHIRPGFWD